ncbi:MAG: hypothetical protein Q8P18_00940 [Pseudomonadota bacterium]|nr:hypothetical protein [Pseudomonadota bacterium]
MILLLVTAGLVTPALAAPDRLASTFEVGTTVTDIVVSPDGAWIGWNEAGGGKFWVMDAGTFETTIVSVCSGARGAAASGDMSLLGVSFYTGCEDGTVAVVEITPAGLISSRAEPLTLGDGAVEAVETDGDNVYAVLQDPALGPVVAGVAVVDGTSLDGFPVELANETIEDTVLMDDILVVAHGTDDVSKVLVSSGELVTPQSKLGGRSLVDAFPYDNGEAVYLADSNGGLVRFQSSSNDYTSSLTNVADAITAVGILPGEEWMVLGAGADDALLYSFSSLPGKALGTIAGAVNLNELVTIEGYAFGTTTDGTVRALSDRPWVSVSSLTPQEGVDGEEVSITFASDVAGDYEVLLNGTSAATGDELADPGFVEADTPTTVSFTIDSSAVEYAEGANTIWVFVKDSAGLVGRGAGTLSIDNPPNAVTLDEAGVQWGNESIVVSFTALEATDIASYSIYFDVEPFTAADYPTGGPPLSGDDAVTSPIVVRDVVPPAEVSQSIYPLTNGTTYYVAVRAIDESGLEGPMSAILSATPQETLSITQRAGEEGGYFPPLCGFEGGGAGAAAIVLASAAVARRRRRFVGSAIGSAAVLALVLEAPEARAADDDEGPRTMNVQVRLGPTTVVDSYVQSVFGDKTNVILWFEYGYASRFIDANLGVGFYQANGFLQTATGESSGEADKFTMVPLTLTLTGRLDFFDEQPIVPFGRVGLDYWMFEENWYVVDPDTTDHIQTGGKYGWHFGGGLLVLLDVFDRRAASRLEAISGINDTFLVAEYRNTRLVHGDNQLNLSSSEVTFGLKFDF